MDYPILKSSTFGCTEISPSLPWVGYWGSREKGHNRAREGNGEWSSQAQCSPLYTETSASFNSGSSSTWDCGLSFQFLCKITKWEAPLCRLSKGKSFRWERRYLRVLVPLRKRRLHEISAALLEIVPMVLLCLFYLFASSPSVFCLSFWYKPGCVWVCGCVVCGGVVVFAFMLHSWNAVCNPCFQKPCLPGMVLHALNPGTPKAEAGACLWVQGLRNEFQDS